MTDCTHTRKVYGHYVTNPHYDAAEDECGGFSTEPNDWVDDHDEPTVVDVDLHHYKCTQCQEIFRY